MHAARGGMHLLPAGAVSSSLAHSALHDAISFVVVAGTSLHGELAGAASDGFGAAESIGFTSGFVSVVALVGVAEASVGVGVDVPQATRSREVTNAERIVFMLRAYP